MQLRTHLKIDQELSGSPVEVGEGYAVVELKTKENMEAVLKIQLHRHTRVLKLKSNPDVC